MPDPTPTVPTLSVVVPVYNVEDYLLACLESLADQTFDDLDVVIVDDGSTDASGAIAEDFSAGRDGWTVLHVENGGLGRARNIGLDHSDGRFVAFVDSDDLVPRDAYELMVHAVDESGSDIVSGGVLRFDGAKARPSGLHRRALNETRMRTHIRRMPSLLYDTTAWNKIYRREFLLENGLRFPEGVYYEDIPLTVPAHYLASSVDVIEQPVYLWRERQTAEQSITQRRAEVKNLVDRMAAVSSVNDFLVRTGETEGKRRHDLKVLRLDMPLFLDVLHEGDREFRDTLVTLFAEYLATVDPALLVQLSPQRRLAYHLVSRGLGDELLEAHEQMLRNRQPQITRRGVHTYAELPFRGDPRLAIPDSVYDVSRSRRLHTGIRDVRWEGDTLVVDGHGYISGVADVGPGSTVHRLQLRRLDGEERQRVRARRVRRPDVTGRSTSAVDYDGCGFLARIPASELTLPEPYDSVEYELIAQVASPAARRGSRVGGPEYSVALHPPRAAVAPGVLAVPGYRAGLLRVAVQRVDLVVRDLRLTDDGGSVRLLLDPVPGVDGPEGWLHLRRIDASSGVSVALERDADGGLCAVVPFASLEVSSRSVAARWWRLWFVPGRDGDTPGDVDSLVSERSVLEGEHPHRSRVGDRRVTTVHLAPHAGPGRVLRADRQLHLRQHGLAGGALVDGPCLPEVTDFSFEPAGLRLEGHRGGAEFDRLVLTSSAEQLEVPVEREGETWSALIPSGGAPGTACLRWLRPGRHRVVVASEGETTPTRALQVTPGVEARMAETATHGVTLLLRTDVEHRLQIVVDGGGDWKDRGAYRQRINRRIHYRVARRMPLEDTILFEAWKGRQYSDNPRAIHEELERRGDTRERVWAVENHGVEVPDSVRTVLVGSRDYYRALGRSRWVVSNDSMPKHYVKRDGTRYGQTWHGTPLKRIGFDIENLQMSNKDYLVQFAQEVRKWDALVSPNAYSTEIFRRAFRFDGPVLETGYPRNDVFHRPVEREVRTAAVRTRLGIDPGRRVILYAPTWRDNHYDRSGRYQFAMKLDLERMYRRFKDDSVLLIRGHQLVAGSVDTSMFGRFALNVSHYPDISDLYLAADVLVTDYSSVMYDFVNTGRPMLFYTHDLEAYRDDLRGFYVDFEAEAPGPLLSHTSEVADALDDLVAVDAAHRGRYAAFREKYASLEDGWAAARFVDRFLGGD